jgi:hypothetical protein
MHRLTHARTVPLAGALATLLSVAPPLRAFERQFHLGGGLGAAQPSGGYDLGPALGVHAAYGLTDAFDLRLELQGSRNAFGILPVSFYGARLGLAYKIDVMQWIPYAGVSAGGFAVAWEGGSLVRPSGGAYVGLDYGMSPHFGLGVFVNGDYILVNPAVLVTSVLLRAEYRADW